MILIEAILRNKDTGTNEFRRLVEEIDWWAKSV